MSTKSDFLQAQFGSSNSINFLPGPGELTAVVLTHPQGGKVTVFDYGAHVNNWNHPEFSEVLYQSPTAVFGGGKAIRGGIPLVFPQFGPGPLPSHGFARTSIWEVMSADVGMLDEASVTFRLSPSAEIAALWPFEFSAQYRISLNEELTTQLSIRNIGKSTWDFQQAFHSYFLLGSIDQLAIKGLEGLNFLDNADNRRSDKDLEPEVRIDRETDRIYLSAPDRIELEDRSLKRRIVIQKRGLQDAVVWNPWIEKAETLKDLPNEDYIKMVCVESANVLPPIILRPGEEHISTQTLSVEHLSRS
jgi:glucose-6-phosphate 1-epimerase